MLKKLLAALGTLALVLGIVALVAGPASAHSHTVDASCAAGVSVNLTNYNTGQANANHVTVWIDDQSTPVTSQAFGGSFAKTYPFATGHATHSYRVSVTAYDDPSGSSGWTFDTGVKSLSGCETAITPAQATSVNAVCTGAGTIGGGGYTIPVDQVGVTYQLWDSGTWTAIAAGTHPAPLGAVIKIQAIPTAGYKLIGTTSWTFTITGPPYSSSCVVPTPPTADYSQCSATPGSSTTASYTIPPIVNGYRFYLQSSTTPLAPGTVIVSTFPSTVVIVAKVTAGHIFPATATTTWTFTFQSPGDCHATVTPAVVTPQHSSCTAPGQSTDNGYLITATTGVVYQLKTGNTWTTLTAGFHDLGKVAGDVEIQALAEPHYLLTGTTDWKFTFVAALDCLVQVPAGDPVFVDATCDTTHPGTVTPGTYTVLLAEHVSYQASVNGGPFTPLTVNIHNPAAPGDVVVIKPIADTGYVISPVIASEKLTHTFAKPGDCLVTTPFVQPIPTSQSCVVTGNGNGAGGGGVQFPALSESPLSTASVSTASSSTSASSSSAAVILPATVTHTLIQAFITIPSLAVSPHALYYIDSVLAAPGDHILPPGTYTVSAMPATGYAFQNYTGPWTEILTSAEPCGDLPTHPLVDPSAVQVQMGCFSDGSYKLSNDLSDSAALTWTVNGSTVSEGTYHVNSASVVTVHVAANGPAYGLEPGATTDWTFTFERPTTCDLKTLALTGSSPTGWIALGYAMLVSGLALLALRFSRRRGEQA